jgi:excisionase family DNA binding protein
VSEDLLRPREVAAIFGVRAATIARWARDGRLTPLRTPGGHRRYSRAAVRDVMAADPQPSGPRKTHGQDGAYRA